MNNEEAKFILGAYRPDGRDAADPQFAAALAQAGRDPELRAWFERQRAFDRTVAAKLGAIAPPAGLREAILAGGRASQPRRRWWASPAWLAAAAAIALLALVGVQGLRPAGGGGALAEFAALAVGELAADHASHEGFPAGLGEVQARLAAATGPLTRTLSIDLEELRRQRCRTVRLGGREAFELCFNRDGIWYHLYVAPRGRLAPGAGAAMAARGDYAAAAWTDAQHVYALVAPGGAAAIQRLI
jgi:hypothetical protein